MQEEVEQKSLTLTVNAAKMTARLFRAAIAKYVAHRKEKKHDAQTGVRYVGRQSVKKLVGQNQGVSNVELSGEDIKAFERVARKYGVDYEPIGTRLSQGWADYGDSARERRSPNRY